MSKAIKFEEAILKLEDAVRLLESGSLTLDESIEKYEDALKALKAAQAANVNRNVVKNGKTTEELLEEMFVEFM